MLSVVAPGVLFNDSDVDGDVLSAVLVSGVSHGVLTLFSNGSFGYVPGENFTGSDGFTYVANDGLVDSNIATVYITVNPANDPPFANDDYYSTSEDTILDISAPGVLGNDTDPDNDTLSSILISNTTNGSLTFNSNGSFVYSPNANYYGPDIFTYKASDGFSESDNATVYITVIAVNDPPSAYDDDYTTFEDTTLNVPAPGVLVNDTDPENDSLIAEKVTDPKHGNVTLNSDGSFDYIPDNNYNGYDNFSYRAYDGTNYSNNATVHINITPVNQPPVANDDTVLVEQNSLDKKIDVLANDFDNDGNVLTIISVTEPNHGSAFTDGNYTYYSPDVDYIGSDQFEYNISDGNGGFDIAVVSITVIHVNHPPDPPMISGSPKGMIGVDYSYAFVATDPDGDDIYYEILWGDGNYEGWMGPYSSDQAISVNHTWFERGIYTIMARAKDTNGTTGEWATLNVWMPRNKAIYNSFILRVLEHFPSLFNLLKYLLGIRLDHIKPILSFFFEGGK